MWYYMKARACTHTPALLILSSTLSKGFLRELSSNAKRIATGIERHRELNISVYKFFFLHGPPECTFVLNP